MSGALYLGGVMTVNRFCICFSRLWRMQYNDENLISDYLTLKWHPNKIYERFLS